MAQPLLQPLVQPLVQQRKQACSCLEGVAFRVWAPHAIQVSVVGTFNDWDASAHPMQSEPRGYWSAFVERARIGDPYSYQLSTDWGVHQRAPC
jgi:1,4-alpha-glucan branching enzyme